MRKILKIFYLCVIACQILLCVNSVAAGSKYDTGRNIVNLMPDFWAFWDKAQNLDQAAKVALFRKMLLEGNKNVYINLVATDDDAKIIQYLEDVKPFIPEMRRLSRNLDKEFARNQRKFYRKFSDLDWNGTIYLLPSLLSGEARSGIDSDEKPVLIFGIDSFAQAGDKESKLATLYYHNLFHKYQDQIRVAPFDKTIPVPLFKGLWQESLAMYVSQKLNPKATLAEVLFSGKAAEKASKMLPQIIKEMRENLDSTDKTVMMNLMSPMSKREDLPPQSGLYVGLMIARELNRKYSLKQLARFDEKAVRDKIEMALIKLETAAAVSKRKSNTVD